MGAFMATLIRVPQEEIKIACQSMKYSNLFHAVVSFYQTGGLIGFYKNAQVVIIRDVLWHTLSYTLIQCGKSYYFKKNNKSLPIRYEFLLGGLIGMIACLLTHPLDVIRTILMVTTLLSVLISGRHPLILVPSYLYF